MIDILRDPMWQFILPMLAIVVAVVLYWKQRTRKKLSYQVISCTPLLSVEEEIEGKLKIFYEGKPVQQVHLITVKVMNSGNIPVLSTDYKRPISFSFGEDAEILTTEIAKTDPDNLQASVNIQEKKVVLTPILLNQGDSVTLKMLVTKLKNQVPEVDGRVVGVKEIREYHGTRTRLFVLASIGLLVELVAGFGAILTPSFEWSLILFSVMVIGAMVGIASFVRLFFLRREL